MKFYVTVIQIAADGACSQSITMATGEDDPAHDDARQKWHQEMSYCRIANVLKKQTCYITDENGIRYEYECWINPNIE